jgi:hypothetical protein
MSTTRRIRPRLVAVTALSALAGVIAVVGAQATTAQRAGVNGEQLVHDGSAVLATTGTLTFTAELQAKYPPTTCPAGSPDSLACFARTGQGIIRGLGRVEESYAYFVETLSAGCPPEPVRVLATTARLSVPGKGAIEIRLPGTGCLSRTPPDPLKAEETFAITGGSSRYAGASGSGTLAHVSYGPPAWRATDTWTGTLVVPGLDFDLTAPTISGAADKLVRVRRGVTRVRVAYAVTARDDVDGTVPTTCLPRSRSWFKVRRTRVRCSATDTSGNEGTAAFVVTVRRGR